MLESEPDLQMQVKNLRGSPQKWGAKTVYFVTVLNKTISQLTKNRARVRHDYGASGIW